MIADQYEPRVRALIADDSPQFLRSIRTFLEGYPWVEVVGTATDGCEALRLVKELQPELALMDIEMPNMNGLEAASKLSKEFPHVRIVMVTLHDTPQIRSASRAAGAGWFVAKNDLGQELLGILNEICASFQMAK